MKFFILYDNSNERRSFFTQLNHFINNERWNKMAEYLVNQENSKWYHQERQSLLKLGSKSSLLYKACCVSAPLDIIKMLLRVVSVDLVKYRSNHQNDFPLHAAARHGSSILVIKTIATLYPEALTAQDKFGRTPLHCSCAKQLNGIYPCLAKLFCTLAPSSVAIEDNSGRTAMELMLNGSIEVSHINNELDKEEVAYIYDNRIRTLNVLQSMTKYYWEDRRKSEMSRLWCECNVTRRHKRYILYTSAYTLPVDDQQTHDKFS